MCKRIFKEETSVEGDIPFYKIGTFGSEPDAFISRELFEDYKSRFSYPEEGAILLSASGTIGRIVEYKGEEAYFQDSNIVWLSHDKSVSNKFLKVLYPTVKWDGIEGSTIQRLYNDNFLKTQFMMPNLPEQEKLGDFFEGVDNLITLHQCKHYQGHSSIFEPQSASDMASFTATWEQRKLGDVVGVYDGTHQTPDYKDQGVMFVSVENIQTLTSDKYISEEDYEKNYSVVPEVGDILMTRIGDIGTANIVKSPEPLAYYVSLALLKNAKLNAEYLKSNISAPAFQNELWLRTLHTAYPKKINKEEIGKCMISIAPQKREQEQIGCFFENLDNLITLHQCKHYQDHSSVFAPQNASDMTSFTATWEQRKLGDQMYIKSRIGWQALTKKEYLDSGDYYLITGTDIDEDRHEVDLSRCYYVSRERYEMDDKIQVHEGDIIVTKDGTIGKVAMVKGLDKPATLNSHLFVLRDLSGKLNNRYLLQILNSHIFTSFVKSTKTGSTLTGLPQKTIVEFVFPVPNIEEQEKIAGCLDKLDNTITLHQRDYLQ